MILYIVLAVLSLVASAAATLAANVAHNRKLRLMWRANSFLAAVYFIGYVMRAANVVWATHEGWSTFMIWWGLAAWPLAWTLPPIACYMLWKHAQDVQKIVNEKAKELEEKWSP